eukprot:GILI01038576.1.p1 GENE.GILI01038576.1~~GILI01038576.1.p1  ORF type:complete len:191 (+),score=18.70 GILI01038576.1:61-633(+)
MAQPSDNRWNLVALAVVSMTNRPLLSQLFLSETATRNDELNLQFLLHSSLDVCDERVDARARRDQAAPVKSQPPAAAARGGAPNNAVSLTYVDSNKQNPCFLHKLLQYQRYWSWGYQSSSSIRVLAVTHGDAPRDVMHQILRQTYDHVSYALCNPFFDYDATLDSDTFLMKITNLVGPHTVMRRVLNAEM